MRIKLPSKKGERVVVWERDEQEGPCRIVMTNEGNSRWSMMTESAIPWDPDDEKAERWADGEYYLTPDALRRTLTRLSLALREYVGFCITPDTNVNDPSFLKPGENVIAKMKGNRCLIVSNFGSAYDGGLLVSIRTNKPLDPGQWIAALGNLAQALDEYDRQTE